MRTIRNTNFFPIDLFFNKFFYAFIANFALSLSIEVKFAIAIKILVHVTLFIDINFCDLATYIFLKFALALVKFKILFALTCEAIRIKLLIWATERT